MTDYARRAGWLTSLLLALVLVTTPSAAHEVPASLVALDIGLRVIDVRLSLPLSELGAAMALPLADDASAVLPKYESKIDGYVRERVGARDRDGAAYTLRIVSMATEHTNNANWSSNDWLVVRLALSAPPGGSTEVFTFEDTLIVHRVLSHETFVHVDHDLRNGLVGDNPQLVGIMGFGKTELVVDGSNGSWWKGLKRLFSLGMEHISEGTDHLLFLLVLLLPAPWAASRGRWSSRKSVRVAFRSIVTVAFGFTAGHSLTLALASAGWLHVPSRFVEIAIAVSILVSSVHAWRPLFAGKEVWIASFFGLVHGLAFASMLSGLNFDGATLAVSLLGFNLGIEWMQLLVIAATLPLLIASSATRAYPALRITGASFGAACAAGWILERGFSVPNPLRPVVEWLAPPPAWVVAMVCAASGVSLARLCVRARSHPRSHDRLGENVLTAE